MWCWWFPNHQLIQREFTLAPLLEVRSFRECMKFKRTQQLYQAPSDFIKKFLKKKKWEGKCQKSVFLKSPLGLIRRLGGEGICHQSWQPELNPCDPHT